MAEARNLTQHYMKEVTAATVMLLDLDCIVYGLAVVKAGLDSVDSYLSAGMVDDARTELNRQREHVDKLIGELDRVRGVQR